MFQDLIVLIHLPIWCHHFDSDLAKYEERNSEHDISFFLNINTSWLQSTYYVQLQRPLEILICKLGAENKRNIK
jgi:hypothetical protein